MTIITGNGCVSPTAMAGRWGAPALKLPFRTTAILLSTGRTGTMALAEYFNTCYTHVCARHEPRPSRWLRVLGNRRMCGRLSRGEAINALARARRPLERMTGTQVYVEANPYLCGFVDVLTDVFGPTRVVHLVRDPREYIRSAINFSFARGMRALATAIVPDWSLKPDRCENPPAKRWRDMPWIERLAWFWTRINGELARAERTFGADYVRVRFEDVFDEDGAGLQSLAGWIGLPDEPSLIESMRQRAVNSSRRRDCPNWSEWPAEWRGHVTRHCDELARRYGYDLTA